MELPRYPDPTIDPWTPFSATELERIEVDRDYWQRKAEYAIQSLVMEYLLMNMFAVDVHPRNIQ